MTLEKRCGEEVRINGIKIPESHIKNCHNFANSYELVEKLKSEVFKNYGHAGSDFIKCITSSDELKAIKKELPGFIDNRSKELCIQFDHNSKIKRAAKRFALISYAGILACKYRILPEFFKNDDYVEECFCNWVNESNFLNIDSFEDKKVLNHIYTFFKKFGESNFYNISDINIKGEIYGYKGMSKNGIVPTDYLVLSDKFNTELCKGYNKDDVKRVLKENNMLRLSSKGLFAKDKKRDQIKITVPNKSQCRVYVITLNKDAYNI